jgi:very-short-patch-repair endonuclease
MRVKRVWPAPDGSLTASTLLRVPKLCAAIRRRRKRSCGLSSCAIFRRSSSGRNRLGQYVADFYCSRQRLVIELDGDSHYTDTAQRYDQARTAALETRGIRVIRFTNTDVLENFEAVCAAIAEALKETPRT